MFTDHFWFKFENSDENLYVDKKYLGENNFRKISLKKYN